MPDSNTSNNFSAVVTTDYARHNISDFATVVIYLIRVVRSRIHGRIHLKTVRTSYAIESRYRISSDIRTQYVVRNEI